ncbi:hypothetical protein NQ504_05400 [Ligilactobacillus ruminis]|jgi:hypothetical protein|uniref:Uncharacterized protein n=1 Tax=Ligilactobacillus ruminis ATCC 25644 TaxID=525362 RepID=E7FP88_9LACO|nr:hypothetical protein [Ligilactobacillus ruminis]EFZ35130.1 hypothetical protein HMPREF0542_10715 [Ligilactobacillus ruminis ATCC 25644]EGX97910.1 hypothetical protein ANHS_1505 [Ligilactobacillus ruminis ATCC 25644]UWP41098.1 hypothetical protein NQ504_05400 [Ligilactobacillus ruminis]
MDTEKLQKIISNLAAEIGNLNIKLANLAVENEKLQQMVAEANQKKEED